MQVDSLPGEPQGKPKSTGVGSLSIWKYKRFRTVSSFMMQTIVYRMHKRGSTSLGAQTVSVCLQCERPGFNPWVGKIPWRRKWQLTPVLLPGKFHGWRSLVGYRPWDHKESDTTEQLHYTYKRILNVCLCNMMRK